MNEPHGCRAHPTNSGGQSWPVLASRAGSGIDLHVVGKEQDIYRGRGSDGCARGDGVSVRGWRL